MTTVVAILAGGLATRLRPITETIPKALVEIAGKPFVFHQLAWLQRQGVTKVVLCVGHLGEMICDVVAHEQFEMTIDYSHDGQTLLGTGGALRKALPKLGETFFVLYGDSYLTCSLHDVGNAYKQSTLPALMTVCKNDGKWDRSNVLYEAGRILRYDKRNPLLTMRHIDYGLNVLSASPLRNWNASDNFDLSDLLTQLSDLGQLAGYEVSERFYEIGSHQGLLETKHFLQTQAGT